MSETNLTVYFEDPFWVGVFERFTDGTLSVCKITFGAEPTDGEIFAFILLNFHALRFSPALEAAVKPIAANPKRRQREAKKQLQSSGPSTRSQQALTAQRELQKTQRRQISRARQAAEQALRFAQKQQKRREKHKGH